MSEWLNYVKDYATKHNIYDNTIHNKKHNMHHAYYPEYEHNMMK